MTTTDALRAALAKALPYAMRDPDTTPAIWSEVAAEVLSDPAVLAALDRSDPPIIDGIARCSHGAPLHACNDRSAPAVGLLDRTADALHELLYGEVIRRGHPAMLHGEGSVDCDCYGTLAALAATPTASPTVTGPDGGRCSWCGTPIAEHPDTDSCAIAQERDAYRTLHDARSGPYNYASQEQRQEIHDAQAVLAATPTASPTEDSDGS